MRFYEEMKDAKRKAPSKDKKPRELPKAGNYSSKELEKSKNTPWRN